MALKLLAIQLLLAKRGKMSKFTSIMDRIYTKDSNYEKMSVTTAVFDTLFNELEKTNKTLYDKTITEFEGIAYCIDKPMAEKMVRAMKPHGQKWTFDQVKGVLDDKGIAHHCINWYLVMNMMYNDYYSTAKAIDKAEDVEFYFHLSKDFIMDADAKPFKVEKYFLD